MKINPIAASTPTVNPNEGQSASPNRIERAKALAAGKQPSEQAPAPKQDKGRSIRMSTNANPTVVDEVLQNAAVTDTPANNEQVEGSEEIKPLSPQFAALAKEKRALQIAKAEFDKQKTELEAKSKDTTSSADLIAQIKSNPLSVLRQHGAENYYDQLTESLLAEDDTSGQLTKLKDEIKALKEGMETQSKTLSEKDAQAEAATFNQIKKEADKLVADGDEYEMIRAEGGVTEVMKLIDRVWKEDGELMDVTEALELVENALIEKALKAAQYKKIQSRLGFGAPQVAAAQRQAKPMKTLTNRDGGVAPMSAKERAIAAFQGKLVR